MLLILVLLIHFQLTSSLVVIPKMSDISMAEQGYPKDVSAAGTSDISVASVESQISQVDKELRCIDDSIDQFNKDVDNCGDNENLKMALREERKQLREERKQLREQKTLLLKTRLELLQKIQPESPTGMYVDNNR